MHAVEDVSLTVRRGETLGIVGESGCGKSTTARLMLRLLEPTSGTIRFDGHDISHMSQRQLRPLAPRDADDLPGSVLVAEPAQDRRPDRRRAVRDPQDVEATRRRACASCSQRVGLSPEHYNRYPHEFSGGQRQRIGVARALALQPKLIVCDEPVSALDVSIQAQILNLLRSLQADFNLTYVFISHDLSVIRQIADRIAVMYLGRIVELGDGESIYEHPKHPYTAALLSAVPRTIGGRRPNADRARRRRAVAGLPAERLRLPSALPALPRGPLRRRDAAAPRSSAASQEVACHFPLERWPMTHDEIRQAEGADRASTSRTSRARRTNLRDARPRAPSSNES